MPEDTLLYLFHDDQGRTITTPDRDEALVFVSALRDQTITETTLGQLYDDDPKALVRARAQYYWAQDLMSGTARGRVV